VFKVSTNGTVFTALYSFTAGSGSFSSITNSDGAYPEAGLILSGNTLYGTAYFGGSSGVGTVFKVNTDGTGFTNLHSFTAGSGSYPIYTNNDGALPRAELFLSGNTLYGTTTTGSSSGTVLVGASQEDSNATGVNGNQSDNSAYASGAAYIFNGLGLGPSLALARDGSGGYFLGFNGVPDLTYRLQRAPSVTGPWSAIVTNTAPASGLIEYHETSPPPGAAFYRTLTP
jgi:uncharacterized repeat protein (TIGR03803 family)